MLLYIHIPFCRAKCAYCAFYSVPVGGNSADRMHKYANTVVQEMALWNNVLAGAEQGQIQSLQLGQAPFLSQAQEIESIFFGGGTPSLLPAKEIDRILNAAYKHFTVQNGVEISMEANPESARAMGYLADVRAAGINRLSLGVQSLCDEQLRRMGRVHSAEDARDAVRLARRAGLENISCDMIWGQSGQSLDAWMQDIRDAIALDTEHLSCYGLSIEEDTPFERAYNAGALALPDDEAQSAMYLESAALLEAHGLRHYEVSNFARAGKECRHNMGYWTGKDYIGLGAAAVSTVQGVRSCHVSDISGYEQAVAAGIAVENAERLSLQERAEEMIMLRLRTVNGLRLADYSALTGGDLQQEQKILLHALQKKGDILCENGYLRVTRQGMLVLNAITEELFCGMHVKSV